MPEESILSVRQQKILDVIRDFDSRFGYPPSIRQIGEATGISSTSVVSYNLDILTRKGYITRDREVSRGLRLVREPRETKRRWSPATPGHCSHGPPGGVYPRRRYADFAR